MSAVLVVAAQECRSKRLLLAAAAVLGFVPLVLRLLTSARLVGEGTAMAFALVAGPVLLLGSAAVLGASGVGADVASGRMRFYLALPVTESAVAMGKVLGALAILVAIAVLVAGPELVVSGVGVDPEPYAVALAVTTLVVVFGLANALGTMVRSRSWFILVDLAAVVAVAVVAYALAARLIEAGAYRPFVLGALTSGAAFGVVLVAAAVAQVKLGRADLRRNHLFSAVVTWLGTGVTLVGLAAWASWVLAATPADVAGATSWASSAPRGHSALFGMRGRWSDGRAGHQPLFLIDVASGQSTGVPWTAAGRVAFSPDGRRAAWVLPNQTIRRQAVLGMARLEAGARPVVDVRPFDHPLGELTHVAAILADGRLVLRAYTEILVGHPGSSEPWERVVMGAVQEIQDLGDERLRLYVMPRRRQLTVYDWDLRSGALTERHGVPPTTSFVTLVATHGDQVLAFTREERILLDVVTGRRRVFEGVAADRHRAGEILPDGRAVLRSPSSVLIAGMEGPAIAVPLAPGEDVNVVRDAGEGLVAIGLSAGPHVSPTRRRTLFVDASSGALRRELDGILPADRPQPTAASEPVRLYVDEAGSLFELTPDGSRRTIVPGKN